MTEPAKPTADAFSGNLAQLAEVAQSFRRIKSKEEYDKQGVRAIWHSGRLRSELLSWETRENVIVRQELSFFGHVIDYRQNHPVRTGRVASDPSAADDSTSRPDGSLVTFDPTLDKRTLEYASHLLKYVPDRDYYAQHLLKHVNEAIAKAGIDRSRTQVSDPEVFNRLAALADKPAPKRTPKALLVGGAVVVALVAGIVLWKLLG